MKHVYLIINARWVVPIDAKQSVLECHYVVINGVAIIAVMPQLTHCPESNLKLTSAIIAHATLGINTITNSLKKDKVIDIIVAKIRQTAR